MVQDGDEDVRGYLNVEVGDVGKRLVFIFFIDKKDLEKENMQEKIILVIYWVEVVICFNMEYILSVYRKEYGFLIEFYQVLQGERSIVVFKMNIKIIFIIMRLFGERNVSDGNIFVFMKEACKSVFEENFDDIESGFNYELTKDSNLEESFKDDKEELLLAIVVKIFFLVVKRFCSLVKFVFVKW